MADSGGSKIIKKNSRRKNEIREKQSAAAQLTVLFHSSDEDEDFYGFLKGMKLVN